MDRGIDEKEAVDTVLAMVRVPYSNSATARVNQFARRAVTKACPATPDPVSIRQYELRGWVAVGFTSEPHRVPLLTDVEQAAQDAADAERIALLKSDAASATSRPSK